MSDSITVILTAYKRDYFKEQLPAIFNQSIKPHKVYIWQNERNLDLDHYKKIYPISIIRSDENTKFFGRFTFALYAQTEYVIIFDDDIIPGHQWIENCLRLSKEKNCIVGQNGRNFRNNTMIPLNEGLIDIKADLVGHSWLFKKDWLKYMWQINPLTFDNGEDIHFCFTAKIFGNIDSYIAKQYGELTGDKSRYGGDEFASYKLNADHGSLRIKIAQYLIAKGWKPS